MIPTIRLKTLLAGVVSLAVWSATSLAQTVTLNPTADAHVRSGTNQNINYGTATTLEIKKSAIATDDFNREIYLKFDLTNVTSVQTAKLRLYGSATSPEIVSTDLYSASNTSWTETGITWANKPATGPVMWDTRGLQNTAAWHEWDISRFLQGEKTLGRNIVTLVLKNSVASTTGTIAFNSRQNGSNKPQLVIVQAFPWTYYEAEAGTKHANATLNSGTTWGQAAFEARGKKTVTLDAQNEYVQWTATAAATHATVRYSIADGQTGTLALYVNGAKKTDLALTSAKMRETHSGVAPADGIVRYFDDVMVTVPGGIPSGATVKLQKDITGSTAYVIDFLELETAPSAGTKPDSTWIDITAAPYNAISGDGGDDRAAIVAAIAAANNGSKKVWIPAGTFDVMTNGGATPSNGIVVPSGIQIRGAGMWRTTIRKNYGGANARLFTLNANTITMQDFKVLGSIDTYTGNGQNVVFRAADFTSGHVVERVWAEYTSLFLGFNVSNNTVRGCRVRNTYKDSIHFARDSSNNLVEKNTIRNSGDDNVAFVSYQNTGMANNIAQYNVGECGWWGRGFTNIGGNGNIVRHNLAVDCTKAGVAVIIETFSGQDTPSCTNWVVEKNVVVGCGDQISNPITGGLAIYAALDKPMSGRMESNLVLRSPYNGARIQGYVGDAGTANVVYFRYNAIEAPVVGGSGIDRKVVSLQANTNAVHTPNTDL